MTRRRRTILDWIAPIVTLIALTVPFWITRLDVTLAGCFYSAGAGWTHGDDPPWRQLYHYGVIPAWIIAISALAVFAASFAIVRWRARRRTALFLVLAMAVGPGLVVNNLFKQNWGRPRPRDLLEFGGNRAYVAPWVKSPRENGNAFASGHAATGFYLLVPYFVLRARRCGWAWVSVIAGLGYGGLIGLARMAQGAHFASDVLWALGFVYVSAVALWYLLGLAWMEAG